MDKNLIKQKLGELRQNAPKRNFAQSVDLVVNLHGLDLRKPEHKVDFGVTLKSPMKTRKLKICAIIDHSISGAENIFDRVIYNDELNSLKANPKKIREVTHSYDRFVVQSNYMPVFAQTMGKYLGPMNKMPSPKLGMIITDKTPLKDLYERLQKTVSVQTKKNLVIQVTVGSEKESDEIIADNINAVYEALVHALPNHQNNIKNAGVKFTMSKLVGF